MTSYIHKILWFVGLVLFQVLILNGIHFLGYATPFLYVYFILTLNADTSRNEIMLWAFCMGLLIDICADTPGVNTIASVLLAFVRPLILRLFSERDNPESMVPSLTTMGMVSFTQYVTAGCLIHSLTLILIEFFSFYSFWLILLRIVLCTFITVIGVLVVEGIRK